MRQLSAAEINPITICKCYTCFPYRPALTLEACIYIHTHEPKAKLNADTHDWHMLKAEYTRDFINSNQAWLCQSQYINLNSELTPYRLCRPELLVPYSMLSHGCDEFMFFHFTEHTPDASRCLILDLQPFLFTQ